MVAKQNPPKKIMEPAQIKYYKDLLLIEILQTWTYDCEAARNIGPDTPEKKNSVIEEAKHVGAILRSEPLCGKRECWRGCKTKSVNKVYGACIKQELQRPVADRNTSKDL